MATKNTAAKAAPKAEKAKAETPKTEMTAGQKAAATKKANASKASAEPAKAVKTPKAAEPKAPAKAASVKLAKPKGDNAPEPKVAPPKAAKAVPAKAQPAEELESAVVVSRKQLAEAVRADMGEQGIGVSVKLAEQLVVSFETAISAELVKGNDVVLPGFGKFKVSLREGRTGRNPATGEAMEFAASKAVSFKPGKALKDAVNAE